MTPNLLTDLVASDKRLSKLARKSKSARAALKKMRRKLKQATRVSNLTEIRMLIGMAQVALSKAELSIRIK